MRSRSLLVASAILWIATAPLVIGTAGAATPLPPRTDRLIYDTANVIDDAAELSLERRHRELFERTGVAIVVVTVPQLVDETIDELAVRVGQSWGVGRAGQDRGLVVALSRNDRSIFVATGYGTEGYLPDGRVGELLDRTAIPHLREGRFSDGLVGLSNALVDASAREYGAQLRGAAPQPAAQQPRGCGLGGIALFVIGLVLYALLARRHPMLALALFASRGLGGGGFGGGFGRRGFGGSFGGGGFGGGGSGRNF